MIGCTKRGSVTIFPGIRRVLRSKSLVPREVNKAHGYVPSPSPCFYGPHDGINNRQNIEVSSGDEPKS